MAQGPLPNAGAVKLHDGARRNPARGIGDLSLSWGRWSQTMSQNANIVLLAALILGVFFSASAAAEPPRRAYAQVDRPTARETPSLTADEVAKLKKELAGARDRQNSRLKNKEEAPPAKSKKP